MQNPPPIWQKPASALVAIVLVAAALRLYGLDRVPPEMNQDEATNAWDAWCLLHTGADRYGQPWPVFYTRGFGDNRTALFLYLMIPFQAAGGLNVWTTRLPGVAVGLGAILLVYHLGARLFGRPTGLIAAGLLAVAPWHVLISRSGNEAGATPLLVLAPLSLMLAAGLPLGAAGRHTNPERGGARASRPPSEPRAQARGFIGSNGLEAHTTNHGLEAHAADHGLEAQVANHGLGGRAAVSSKKRPKPLLALLAGLVGGVCCYGYPAVRIVLPLLLLCAVVVNAGAWRRLLAGPRGRAAAALWLAGFAITFGLLVVQHVLDFEQIARRGGMTWVWEPEDSWPTRVAKVAARYPAGYGPNFLFLMGDAYAAQKPPDGGELHLYMAPLLVAGLIGAAIQARTSAAARFLLAWLLLYPLPDALTWHVGAHALRSSTGLGALVLLAALGTCQVGRWAAARWPAAFAGGVVVGALVVAGFVLRFVHAYFTQYPHHPLIWRVFQADLVQAAHWLRPRLAEYDAVLCTTQDFEMPYVNMLVGLRYDPRAWRSGPLQHVQLGPWEAVSRFGKVRFLYDTSVDAALRAVQLDLGRQRAAGPAEPRHWKILLILRPDERPAATAIHRIHGPPGTRGLALFEVAP
jgi:hypothetical protein